MTEADLSMLIPALKKLGTRQVVMSGGEALLHNNFFRLCGILKKQGIKITLLSTGLLLKKHAENIVTHIDEVIISLDGDAPVHDAIRNINGAFDKLAEGVRSLQALRPGYRITARTVIHKLNYRSWAAIIGSAKKMGLQQVSFLPADVSSHAFNREILWSNARQHELLLNREELEEMKMMIEDIIMLYEDDIHRGFIAESAVKLMNIYRYYAAFHGINDFPFKKCNAPWVSAVIEPNGAVRPCFFHEATGNIRDNDLMAVLNSEKSIRFRQELDMANNALCKKCVCSLNLPVTASL